MPTFWAEAEKEAKNYAKARGQVVAPPAFVIVKRRSASIEQAWVIQPLEKWIEQMPVPQGQITSTQSWNNPPVEEVVETKEEVKIEEVVVEEKPKRKKKAE